MFFKREPEKTILFLCVENTGRSQIAEGFFNKYAPKRYRAISAGTKPVPKINPMAVEVMKEVGIDISNQISKDITEVVARNSTYIVNMGCMERMETKASHSYQANCVQKKTQLIISEPVSDCPR
jgi:arsenate reductase